MKFVFRLTLLALAAFGAKALYDRLRPQVDAAGDTKHRIVDETLTPAFREATVSVKNASTHAAHEVADAAQQAASEHEPLSAMAEQDLGVQGRGRS